MTGLAAASPRLADTETLGKRLIGPCPQRAHGAERNGAVASVSTARKARRAAARRRCVSRIGAADAIGWSLAEGAADEVAAAPGRTDGAAAPDAQAEPDIPAPGDIAVVPPVPAPPVPPPPAAPLVPDPVPPPDASPAPAPPGESAPAPGTPPDPPSGPHPPAEAAPPNAPDPTPALAPKPSPPQLSNAVPVSTPDSLVVGIDGGHDEWWSDTIKARAALGAAITRHEWDPAEPVNSRDGLVFAAAAQVHTRVHALLGANDLGAAGHYRDWVVAFVRRYGPGGDFWDEHPQLDETRYAITTIELGNEPYFGEMSPTEYAAAARPALERIAELSLPVKVILPSYIHGERTTWIDTLYEEIPNLNSLFYAFADHPYWYAHHPADHGDNGPFERIDTLRARMDYHNAESKPIYLTEYGESTASCGEECVSEAAQAEHLRAMLDAVVTREDWNVEMLSVFQLHDWNTNSSDREEQFGLLRENGAPKPSYSIVREAMQRYRG